MQRLKDSFHQGDLLMMPLIEQMQLVNTLNPFEFKILMDNNIKSMYYNVMHNHMNVKKQYKAFSEQVNNNYTKDQLTLIFKRTEIKIDDFSYLYYIMHENSLKINQKYVLYPIFNHIQKPDHIGFENHFYAQFGNKEKQIQIINGVKIQKSEQILRDYQSSQGYEVDFLTKGIIPKRSECFHFQILQGGFAQKFKVPETMCLESNIITIKSYYMLGLRINMDEKQALEFDNEVLPLLQENQQQNLQLYADQLDKYQKNSIVLNIDIWYKFYQNYEKILKLETTFYQYYEFRKENKLNTQNAQKFYEFYKVQSEAAIISKQLIDYLKNKFQQ